MRLLLILVLPMILLTGFSPTPKRLTPEQFIDWVDNSENGLVTSLSGDEFDYLLRYQPHSYLAIKSIQVAGERVTKESLKTSMEELGDLEYYQFYISLKEGKKNLVKSLSEESSARSVVDYLAWRMQDDVSMMIGSDTLKCKLYHFEQTFGVTSYASFTLGFEPTDDSKRGEERKMLLQSPLFGDASLSICADCINEIPKLRIKE